MYDDDEQGDHGEEHGGLSQHQAGPATEPPTTAAAGEVAAAPAERGAAADAAERERIKKKNKKKKKKTGRPGVVEQLKAKTLGGSADGAVDGAQGGDGCGGEGGDGVDASPPEMGLLDAVAAMILGETSG